MKAAIITPRATLDLPLDGARLIEASAGTGKTYTIANLYLRHILAGRAPAEVLVVTFTNAATDELRQRIHARLRQALQAFAGETGSDDDFLGLLGEQHRALEPAQQLEHTRRLRYALRSMDQSMIATIHGFCHAALRDHAFLCNRQFDYEIVANDEQDWEQALKDWWRASTYNLPRAEWDLLGQAITRFDDLLEWHRLLRSHPRDDLLPSVDISLAQLLATHRESDPEAEDFERLLSRLRARALAEAHAFASRRVAAARQARGRMGYQDQLDLLQGALESAAGSELAARLRRRFPVAMIDEFQDTDPVQYDIFRRLFFHADACLTLIGDPKQAIYGFRGGDIFTYIEARAEAGIAHYALTTNWRSQAGVVAAVNHVFGRRPSPFVFDRAIEFIAVEAAERNRDSFLQRAGTADRALTLWQIPRGGNGKNLTVAECRERINLAVAGEIARLLDPASDTRIDGNPLRSGDIAILVRERSEGEALRKVLLAAGIRAVSIGRDKVFASAEARALADLLEAIANPADERRLRRARACGLFDLDYVELAAIVDDDARWQAWIDLLQRLHALWVARGFIVMFAQMLEELNPCLALARQPSAERRLTNLVHLGELLQQQSQQTPAIEALLAWYRRQMSGESGDEAELRLESDTDLVKIVTIHQSKGLEYPVVFLPFMWRCRLATSGKTLRFHDEAGRGSVDLGSEDYAAHGFLAERERLAEDLRLLYVAMTRARSKLYLAWGDAGSAKAKGQPMHTALAYLLHSRQTPDDLALELPRGFDDAATLEAEIGQLAHECEQIEVCPLPTETTVAAAAPAPAAAARLEAATFSRDLGSAWRINSFSSLTRDVHQAGHGGETEPQGDAILDFPAGSHIGLLLHQLLENIDFSEDIPAQAEELIARLAPAYGVDTADHRHTLGIWLQHIVDSPIDAAGLRLGRLDRRRRLNELKFDFALDHLDIGALNRRLQEQAEVPLQAIEASDFRGLLTGVIDLVFEHEGRFYLADYKTNFLGARLDDYAPPALARAMYDRRYDLQLALYALALNRYLAQRLPYYRYDDHFGGCYYLFLRALRPPSGPRFGVHFERPSKARLDVLEELFAFTPRTERPA